MLFLIFPKQIKLSITIWKMIFKLQINSSDLQHLHWLNNKATKWYYLIDSVVFIPLEK